MQTENRIRIDKLLHTRETVLKNIAVQKENLARQGKRVIDVEMLVGASVGLVGFFGFNVELMILKHLLFLLLSVVIITALYVLRVSKSFTRLEKEVLRSLDLKIETLTKDRQVE